MVPGNNEALETGEGKSERSRPPKRQREKKPQRGLGVAQLEKLRLEEEQENAIKAYTSRSIKNYIPVTLPSSSSPFMEQHSGSSSQFLMSTIPSIPLPATLIRLGNNSITKADEIQNFIPLASQELPRRNGLLNSVGNSSLPCISSELPLRMEPPSNQNRSLNLDRKIRSLNLKRPRSVPFSSSVLDFLSLPSSSAAAYSKSMPRHTEKFTRRGTKLIDTEELHFNNCLTSKVDVNESAFEEGNEKEASDNLDLSLKL